MLARTRWIVGVLFPVTFLALTTLRDLPDRPSAGVVGPPPPASAPKNGGEPSLDNPRTVHARKAGKIPSDWFLRQRAWPQADVDQRARLEAFAQARRSRSIARNSNTWQPVGPTNVGGRIADIACHPTDPSIVYAGTASGGVFKTTDGGTTWFPTFDDESSLSIGSVAVDPGNAQTIWVGTGEPNGGGGSVTYGGTGVFRSTDGAATWQNMGLTDTRYIGRVRVHPSDPNTVFVAALGSQWTTSPDRGVYRTTDAGSSWDRVLASTDSTGAVDLLIHPTTPSTVYAVMWERSRGPDYLDYGGPTSGLFRSTDGGDTWGELTSGLPSGDRGRIGIAQCESQPNVMYAIYAESNPGAFVGLYRSTDAGLTWSQTNDSSLSGMYSSFGWWFGNVRVDPDDPDVVFALGLDSYRSTNGGSSWSWISSTMHVDHHALDFASDGTIFEGNDGGMYRSTNGGSTWAKLDDLPVNQFYAIEVDEQFPDRRYGGMQDNGTQRTLTGADDDWSSILGGDGFRPLVDPVNNQYVYAEYQRGALFRSSNGGSSFSYIGGGIGGNANWSMPVAFDPQDPATLFAGTQQVWRSTNRGTSWSSISPDLTDGGGGSPFGTITTIAISPVNSDHMLVGTDDANVWRTSNGGGTWTQVDAVLPERWVTRVAFDPANATHAYVTISGFRYDEYQPHVFRTTNLGDTWTDVSGDLPQAPVNDIVVDPQAVNRLYVATDFGVYLTVNLGGSWFPMGNGLPNVVVNDLELHDGTRTLLAGTYGRSMWAIDLEPKPTDVPLAASGRGPGIWLAPISPNPVREGPLEVRWTQAQAADVRVTVHDVTGRRVAGLASGPRTAGNHRVAWNPGAAGVGSGVFLVRLESAGAVTGRKLTVVD